jgi:transposase
MFRYEASMNDSEQMQEMKRRRVRGVRLLKAGKHAAEVARRTGVSRQSVMRWERALASKGFAAVAQVGQRGRPRRLTDTQLEELGRLLKQGAVAAGYATEIWTTPRIGALIAEKFGVRMHNGSVWRVLREQMGWSVQRPTGQARQRDERAITTWKKKRWPELKK